MNLKGLHVIMCFNLICMKQLGKWRHNLITLRALCVYWKVISSGSQKNYISGTQGGEQQRTYKGILQLSLPKSKRQISGMHWYSSPLYCRPRIYFFLVFFNFLFFYLFRLIFDFVVLYLCHFFSHAYFPYSFFPFFRLCFFPCFLCNRQSCSSYSN
jgi:hypothetical protein